MNTISVHTIYGQQTIPVVGSLLESLERSSVRVESHCRGGYCGACKVRLVEGEVDYFDEPLGFVEDGEILTCCSTAKTNVLLDVR